MSNDQNANLVFLSNVRISFPHLLDPQVQKNDQGQETRVFNCDFILEPNDPGFAKFMSIYQAMAQEKWKENAQAAMQRIQSDRKTRCYAAGEERVNSTTFQVLNGYAGKVSLTARSSRQPQIIRPDGTPCDPANMMELRAVGSKIYAGCRVNAVVKPWLQQNEKGIGVRCDLIAVQFHADDQSFESAPADVSNMFGAVAGGAPAPSAPAPQMPAAPFPGLPSFLQ